ncbi:hypothetical protein FRC07_013704 [Ceratobasidium sp. 392]|nr:hypothetical protein FRC07_013704 [Ceratobasidium sp. 392]
MFSAWIVHNSNNLAAPIEYSVFPANKNRRDFENTADRLQPYTIANTDIVSAAVSSNCRTLGAAFWKADGGSVSVPDMGLVVYVNKPLVLMLKLAHDSSNGELSVSDPTHEATEANVRVVWTSRELLQGEGYLLSRSCRTGFNGQSEVALTIKLPAGGMAGSTVTQKFER